MRDFDQLIQEDVAGYQGPHEDLIHETANLYLLFTHLLEDPRLPERLRPLVISVIAYFIMPTEIMPEYLIGAQGYQDDIFLCAYIADLVRQQVGEDSILTGNWEGKRPILPLMEAILARENELIDDKRDLILWYIGYKYIVGEE